MVRLRPWFICVDLQRHISYEASGLHAYDKRIVSVVQPEFVPVVKRVSGAQHSLPIFQSSSTSDRKLGRDDKRASLPSSYSFEDEDGESYRLCPVSFSFISFSLLIFLFETANMAGNGSSNLEIQRFLFSVPNICGTPVLPAFLLIAPLTPKELRGREGKDRELAPENIPRLNVKSVSVVKDTIM